MKSAVVEIESRILVIRTQRVIIDVDLAELYGVTTKRLNEQVRRNIGRFPSDFMFSLSAAEKSEVVANCDHLAKLKFSKTLPHAFTEHGDIQAANVLGSPEAIQMGVYVVRSFVRLREMLASDKELAARLGELEAKLELISQQQGGFEEKAVAQFQQIFEAMRSLMAQQPPHGSKRPIGFVLHEDKSVQP